jgi:hypothetical protein
MKTTEANIKAIYDPIIKVLKVCNNIISNSLIQDISSIVDSGKVTKIINFFPENKRSF